MNAGLQLFIIMSLIFGLLGLMIYLNFFARSNEAMAGMDRMNKELTLGCDALFSRMSNTTAQNDRIYYLLLMERKECVL